MRRLLLLSSTLFLFACPESGDDEIIDCPTGTVRVDGVCSAPDAGLMQKDAGPTDGGGTDAGSIDTGVTPDGGQTGQATLSATDIDFGGTLIGGSASRTLSIENRTAEAVLVSFGPLSGSGEADFVLTSTPASNMSLAAGASITVTIEHRPTTERVAVATLPIELCETGCSAQVVLTGTGLRDAIVCAPNPVDFGFVNPGSCSTIAVDCTNESNADAAVLDWALTSNSSPAFMAASATTSATLSSGEVFTIDVDYCPTALGNDNGTIALTTDHPDPQRSTKAIPVIGTGGGPDIDCTPSVDFGIAGIGQSVVRSASCTNQGDLPLLVSAAAFDMGATPELAASLTVGGMPVTLPATLAAGEALEIELSFQPAAAGTHTETFRVTSNDGDTPEATIAVTAEALASNGCLVQISPQAIDFGSVAPGRTVEAEATVSNTGTADCAVNVIGVTSSTAPEFAVVGGAQSFTVAPGDSAGVRVAFSPSAVGTFSGDVQLTTTDVTNAMPLIGLTGAGYSPFGSVSVTPAAISFGQVQAGCTNAATQPLTIQNTGQQARDVTVTLEAGTPSEFRLITMTSSVTTTSSATIPAGGLYTVTVGFLPGGAGSFSGRVRVDVTGGPTLYVPLDGEGTPTPGTTVTFPGRASPQVDVLLVVDDSCSMTEEQGRLSTVAPILIDRGDALGAEYNIAVTTTDPGAASAQCPPGSPQGGTLRGSPSVVDWASPTRSMDLAANILQGTQGCFDERGLFTATEAVTNPTLLSGPNAGFLRPNADLVIIIISDEPDFSPDTVPDYLTQLSTRPIGNGALPRVYTITGGLAGCTGVGTTAPPSPRYVEAAVTSGGFDREICLQDYTQIVTEIANETFAPARTRFPLGAAPVPGSVVVRVDGVQAAATDFGVDFITNEVVFLPGSVPLVSQTVEVDYATQCVPASCGNGQPDSGEQCDDGNPDNLDACLDSCLNAFCGDTYIYAAGEQCDDGNTVSGDGCNAQCTIEGCGNGIPEPPEECDDGQNNSDVAPDACRTNCLNAFCGDNVQDTNEQCDDGNQIDTDACVGCMDAFCGDGFVQAGVEECDDGNQIDTDACDNNCSSNLINFVVATTSGVPLTPAAGTPVTLGDDAAPAVPIGFPFSYLGVPVTDVYVGSNGLIAFAQAGATAYQNAAAIPAAANPNAIVAWWWDDLNPARTNVTPLPEVRTAVTGTAPNRVMTITYENIPRFGTAPGTITAEIRLVETTNVIEVHYGSLVDPAGTTIWSATTGWESDDGLRGADTIGCTPTCASTDWPADTVYTFTPQ